MIQPNELQIGNLIDCFGQCEVIRIGQKKIRVRRATETGFILEKVPLNSLSLKPIPITEEKLLELGFLSIEKNDVYKFDSYSNGSQYRIYYDTDYKEPVYRIEDIVSVKYVHELQNLFFSLTKQELIKK